MKDKMRMIRKKVLNIMAVISVSVVSAVCLCGCLRWSYGDGITFSNNMVSGSMEVEEFDQLEIDVSSYEVLVKRGDSPAVEYNVPKGREPKIEQKDGKLKISQPTGIAVFFNFIPESGDTGYTITVPDDRSITFTATSSSGDIMTDHVNVSGKIETTSGDVLITGAEGGQLEINTVSGDIGADSISNEKSTFNSISGEIALLRINSDVVLCNTTSGDTDINNSETGNLTCTSISGEVTVGLNGSFDEHSFDISTTSGDITVNGQEADRKYTANSDKGRKIVISTVSADVDVSVN